VKLQRKNRLRAASIGALAVSGALVLTACGSDDNSSTTAASGKTSAASHIKCDGKGNLLASGSSAQANAMDLWVKNYTAACKGVQINYKPNGSGAGIQELLQGKTSFAGSDSALKPEEIASSKKIFKGGQGIDLPMVGGPIAVGYNVPGVTNLVLNADTIGKIFNSKITKWNDPAIAALNKGVKLPDLKIQAFHRSDDSGTTDNFTKYLKAAAPSAWPYEPAKKWEAKGGQSADGSAGLAAQVKQTSGSISYFELSYATAGSINTAKLNTGASAPVEATTDNASKAIAQAKIVGTGSDLALQLAYNTKAEGAYPLALVTYEIVGSKGNKADTLAALKSYLAYISSSDAQTQLKQLGYAPLPSEIAAKVQSTIKTLS
jgi:phosphate transport system substrate-binding protein